MRLVAGNRRNLGEHHGDHVAGEGAERLQRYGGVRDAKRGPDGAETRHPGNGGHQQHPGRHEESAGARRQTGGESEVAPRTGMKSPCDKTERLRL